MPHHPMPTDQDFAEGGSRWCRHLHRLTIMATTLFDGVVTHLTEAGLIVEEGALVDGSIIEPRAAGAPTLPGGGLGSTKPKAATCTKKHGRTHHGYKAHASRELVAQDVTRARSVRAWGLKVKPSPPKNRRKPASLTCPFRPQNRSGLKPPANSGKSESPVVMNCMHPRLTACSPQSSFGWRGSKGPRSRSKHQQSSPRRRVA